MKGSFKKDKIKNICRVFSGATPSTDNTSFWNGDILWITPNDLSKLRTPYFSNTERKITLEGLNGCSTHLLPKGSLVMSSRAPIGYLAIADHDFATNQGCKSFSFYDNYDSLFFYYCLKNQIEKLKVLGEGTTFAEISKSYIEEFEIYFPEDKSEQIAIACILKTVDEAIEKTENLIAKYQNIKTGLMQDLLTKGIDENGNIRNKTTHRFVKKNGIEVPENWEVFHLENICKKITDGSHFSPKPQVEGRLIGNVKDMKEDGFNFESCTKILESDFQTLKLQNCSPEKGDVLLSKDGTIGRVLFFNLDFEMVVLSSIAILRPREDFDGTYLSYLLKSEYFYKQLIALESGSALRRIVLKDIRSLKFPFPNTKEEQNRISNRLNQIDNYIQNENAYLSKLLKKKSGLMQDLLSGKVRVN
ncbi:MAG: restriction endonuclease subunit S [Bacteroidota bacterium]